ncbi:MAG TPA: rhodanese-like domain-containing protein [Lacipirellulaceae bacterium]|nr:rhodanese-like domain-containing protein [Lacipirellulaceae bacterium]
MSLIHLLLIVPLVASNAARNNVQFTKDSLQVVKQNVEKHKAVLVDVRSEEEWKQGHIEGSIFLPVTSLRRGGDPKVLAKVLPPKKILYTFCTVGMRARAAAYVLEKRGYNVRALKPGYDDLVKFGFKKAKPKPQAAKNESSRQRNAG